MPRLKGKRAPPKKADSAASITQNPNKTAVKRKIDWATIDDPKPFGGFSVKAMKVKTSKQPSEANKKQKGEKSTQGERKAYMNEPLHANIVQKNPFPESDLSETNYAVTPPTIWESTSRYRRFTISEAEFEVGQIVFIEKPKEKHDTETAVQHWIGRVLEVRAGDTEHVYLRVYWLYRPEDLPDGRKAHHGETELVASNHMDIIDATTVQDRAVVVHWDEDPDKSDWPLKDQLFWRQTYDIGKPKGQQLSKLKLFCIDKAPCNPDEPLIYCPACSGWLHARCLEDQAVQHAQVENKIAGKGQQGKTKKKRARQSSSGVSFVAHLTTPESGEVCLTLTDKRPGKDERRWNVDVNCLLCDALIEAAAQDVPKVSAPKDLVTIVTDSIVALAPQTPANPDEDDDSVASEEKRIGEESGSSTRATTHEPTASSESTVQPSALVTKILTSFRSPEGAQAASSASESNGSHA
ncbi:hypothetical protein GQ44DRAFT_601970 [Phaeosphaeriaceae sp. PMI808]|nr:hypothetical protein GQ44DRAFT_601970 [Phaeosphaeriaceae sp. PMI808]